MDYRYLETTGVLNEAGPVAGRHGRRPSSVWKDRERGGGKPPIWRGKPIPRALCRAAFDLDEANRHSDVVTSLCLRDKLAELRSHWNRGGTLRTRRRRNPLGAQI